MRSLSKALKIGIAVTALAWVLSGVQAYAQGMPGGAQGTPGSDGGGAGGGGKHRKGAGQSTQQQSQVPKVDEKEYRSAIDRLPDKKFDPWQNAR